MTDPTELARKAGYELSVTALDAIEKHEAELQERMTQVEVLEEETKKGKKSKQELSEAKKRKNDVKRRLDNIKKADRRKFLNRRREAESKLEDFYYYRNRTHRRLRHVGLEDPKHLGIGDSFGHIFRIESIKPSIGWLKERLEEFDADDIGNIHVLRQQVVSPENLNLFTPFPRHKRNRPVNVDLEIDIDLEALEKKRREVEDQRGATDKNPLMTHSERRRDELTLNGTLETANLDLIESRKSRTDSGLWIAALETSDDWKTSYLRDPVRPTSPTSPMEVCTPTPSASSPSSSSSGSPSLQIPPVETATASDGEDAYDSDQEDPLYLEYKTLARQIFG